jgi:hypothetical protein
MEDVEFLRELFNTPLYYARRMLENAANLVNSIKVRPKNLKIFGAFCYPMCSIHNSLLTYPEIRWLSRDIMIVRWFFSLEMAYLLFIL